MIQLKNFKNGSTVQKVFSKTVLDAITFLFYVDANHKLEDLHIVEEFQKEYYPDRTVEETVKIIEEMMADLLDEETHDWDSPHWDFLAHILSDVAAIYLDMDLAVNTFYTDPKLAINFPFSEAEVESLKKELSAYGKEVIVSGKIDENELKSMEEFCNKQVVILYNRLVNPGLLHYDLTLMDGGHPAFKTSFLEI